MVSAAACEQYELVYEERGKVLYLAHSLRIDYDFLEKEPHMVIKKIETAKVYYDDLFVHFLEMCLEKSPLMK